MKRAGMIFAGCCLFWVIAFFIADFSGGKTRFLECYVADREYKPAWTDISTYTDSDGHTQVTTIHHPEEYHLICYEHGESVIDVSTSRGIYYTVTNHQEVTVKVRQGRWTHAKYVPQIDL